MTNLTKEEETRERRLEGNRSMGENEQKTAALLGEALKEFQETQKILMQPPGSSSDLEFLKVPTTSLTLKTKPFPPVIMGALELSQISVIQQERTLKKSWLAHNLRVHRLVMKRILSIVSQA